MISATRIARTPLTVRGSESASRNDRWWVWAASNDSRKKYRTLEEIVYIRPSDMLAVQVEESTEAGFDISDVECRSDQKQVVVVRLRYCDDHQQRRGDCYIHQLTGRS